MGDWDPELYNRFRGYRAQPVEAIMQRLRFEADERIADLGCGSGENTVELARRTPRGTALGIDSSPAMLLQALELRSTLSESLAARVRFEQGEIASFTRDSVFSLIFSNAAFQWVGNHRAVFANCFRSLAPGGRMVVQMPANEHESAKVTLGQLARREQWRERLGGVEESFPPLLAPERYQTMLAEIGFVEIDCYYQTFNHPMNNPGEVVQWYRATGLRPFLNALPAGEHERFLNEWRERLREAYGTSGAFIFNFRRLFVWARRPQ